MRTLGWLLLLALCVPMAHANRADPAAAFPAAARVLADIRGEDETETLARKFASVELLRDALNTLAPPSRSNQLTPTALARHKDYGLALQRLWETLPPHYDATCKRGMSKFNPLAKCEKTVLVQTTGHYRRSPEFARNLLARHLPPRDVDRFIATATTLDRSAPALTYAQSLDQVVVKLSPRILAGVSPAVRFSGAFALFSLAWLLPAGLAYLHISTDRAETRRFSGWTPSGPFTGKVETGNTERGDPEFARRFALGWTLVFLPVIACLFLMGAGGAPIVINLAVCAALLVGAWKFASALGEADGGLFGLLRRVWYVVLGVATLHMLAWAVLFVKLWTW